MPQFDLVFTSPPYRSIGDQPQQKLASYYADLRAIFEIIRDRLRSRAKIVIEMANVREGRNVRTIAWGATGVLTDLFHFDGELVRCIPARSQPASDLITAIFSSSQMK